jgi:hypothetical protein
VNIRAPGMGDGEIITGRIMGKCDLRHTGTELFAEGSIHLFGEKIHRFFASA